MSRTYRTRLLCLLACIPLMALAGTDERDTTAWLGLTAQSFHYWEYRKDDGSLADRESGWVPGVHAAVEHDFGAWFGGATLDWSRGAIDHAEPELGNTTDSDIRQLELHAGLPVWRQGRHRLSVVAGLGAREWRRDIRNTVNANGLPVYGQDETYRWGYVLLGVRGDYQLQPVTHLALELQLVRPHDPDLKVDFNKESWDSVRLGLGAKTGYRVRLLLERQIDERRSLWLSPWYEYWALDRSADVNLTSGGTYLGTLYEPDSETGTFGFSAGVRWLF